MNLEYNHFDLVIATPGKEMISHYTKALVETINFLNDNNIKYCYLNEYSSHVAQARQRTYESFYIKFGYNAKYKKMIWIDSDISWSIYDFNSMFESDKDIVSGAYMTDGGKIAAHRNARHTYTLDELDLLKKEEKILYCGMGFMSIKFGILENIQNPFYPTAVQHNEEVFYPLNEDVAFCIKAQNELNKSVWLNPNVRVRHHKTVTLGWY